MKISKLKKKIKILAIVLMILVVLLVIILFIANSLKSKMRSFYDVSENIVIDEVYNNLNRITINSNLSDIYIKNSLDNTSKIVVYGNSDLISYNTNNNKLTLTIKEKNCVGICIKNEVSKVEIYLPNTYSNVIDITNKYGNIEIEKFENASIDIKQKYGDIKIEYSKFSKINSEQGNVALNNSKLSRINLSYGNIDINEVDDIEIESKHSNINIKKINSYLEINNDYGDIIIDNVILDTNSDINIEYGDVNIKNISGVYIKAKTDLGDLKIKNNNKKSDIILKIENECGDIKIN